MTDKKKRRTRALAQKLKISHALPRTFCIAPASAIGEPLPLLVQRERGAKKVFVLDVYASAVHARWFGADGKLLVRALAVASEPVIFWDGSGVDDIIVDIASKRGRS